MHSCIAQSEALSENEIKRLIYDFNKTKSDYSCEKTVHQLFEEQVERSPKNIAVSYKDKRFTYEELNAKANQVAHWLRKAGINRDSIVGLMVQRSLDMMVGILGILKAGGAYLPLDPQYPEARIKYMLEDSGARILLTQKHIYAEGFFDGNVVFLDDDRLYDADWPNPVNINYPNDIAYVIYTSGSTGKPKGVMVEHKGINNFIKGISDIIDFSHNKIIVSLTTISFDIFVLESFLPLSKGMQVVIADPRAISEYIAFDRIEMLQTTPSTMTLILNDPSNLRYLKDIKKIMLGGEEFPPKLLAELRKLFPKAEIFNMYGPTETTVWSTVKNLTASESVNIGEPISNTQIYILDEALNIMPIGVPGELYISGDGLARGYLNKPDLTAERFINNPFIQDAKMYRTGDIARWNADGEIEYVSRADHQVKIRGFRIELKEIEECLREYYKIKECVVAAKSNKYGDKYLAAYYVSDSSLPVSELINHLKKSIPEYMIPGFFIWVDKIPLTPNGKLDRNSLPEPENSRSRLEMDYKSPENDIEVAIVDIWKKVLNLELVGTNDNFFELGGNSILLSLMYAEIEQHYPGKINIADLFDYTTVSKLAACLFTDTALTRGIRDIKTLRLPLDYISDSNRGTDGISLKAKISNDTIDKLAGTQIEGIDTDDILLGLYAYLLSEISNQKEVTIYKIIADNKVAEVSLDTNIIATFFELFRMVSNTKNTPSGYEIKDLNKVIFTNKSDSVIPVFISERSNSSSVNISRGLSLQVQKEADSIELTLHCEAENITREKVKGLMYNYINLIKAYADDI